MRRARFQLFRVGSTDVGWRFVATNNRELARSPGLYDDEAQARAAVTDLLSADPAAELALSRDDVGRWRWEARLDGSVQAVSSRTYLRRIECESSVEQFRASVRSAQLAPAVAAFHAPFYGGLGRDRHTTRPMVPPARRPLVERRGPVPSL